MDTMIKIIAICWLIWSTEAASNSNSNIKCSDRELESLFNRLIIVTGTERKFPEKSDQMGHYCTETFRLVDQVDRYKRNCLNETVRNLVSVVNYSMKTQNRRICNNRKSARVRNLIAAAPCVNSNRVKLVKCIDLVSVNFAGIKTMSNEKKMPQLCCQYVQVLDCLKKTMTRAQCGQHYQLLEDQLQSVVGNFVDQSCGEYNRDTDKCDKLEPIPKVNVTNKSFVFNLIGIFESIK